jgi:hypothetical protein
MIYTAFCGGVKRIFCSMPPKINYVYFLTTYTQCNIWRAAKLTSYLQTATAQWLFTAKREKISHSCAGMGIPKEKLLLSAFTQGFKG